METTLHTIHTAKVTNNCPECYSTEGLELTFTQQEVQNKLFRYVRKEVKDRLYCKKCDQTIYPVKWTEDIERVHEYNRKLLQTMGLNLKILPLGWVLLTTDALLLLAIVYYLTSR